MERLICSICYGNGSFSDADCYIIIESNRSSAWLFGGPEFESRTPQHHCTFSCMPVYFWEQVGICSSDVGALSQRDAVRRFNT
jgi:hypothetical protein